MLCFISRDGTHWRQRGEELAGVLMAMVVLGAPDQVDVAGCASAEARANRKAPEARLGCGSCVELPLPYIHIEQSRRVLPMTLSQRQKG